MDLPGWTIGLIVTIILHSLFFAIIIPLAIYENKQQKQEEQERKNHLQELQSHGKIIALRTKIYTYDYVENGYDHFGNSTGGGIMIGGVVVGGGNNYTQTRKHYDKVKTLKEEKYSIGQKLVTYAKNKMEDTIEHFHEITMFSVWNDASTVTILCNDGYSQTIGRENRTHIEVIFEDNSTFILF